MAIQDYEIIDQILDKLSEKGGELVSEQNKKWSKEKEYLKTIEELKAAMQANEATTIKAVERAKKSDEAYHQINKKLINYHNDIDALLNGGELIYKDLKDIYTKYNKDRP